MALLKSPKEIVLCLEHTTFKSVAQGRWLPNLHWATEKVQSAYSHEDQMVTSIHNLLALPRLLKKQGCWDLVLKQIAGIKYDECQTKGKCMSVSMMYRPILFQDIVQRLGEGKREWMERIIVKPGYYEKTFQVFFFAVFDMQFGCEFYWDLTSFNLDMVKADSCRYCHFLMGLNKILILQGKLAHHSSKKFKILPFVHFCISVFVLCCWMGIQTKSCGANHDPQQSILRQFLGWNQSGNAEHNNLPTLTQQLNLVSISIIH